MRGFLGRKTGGSDVWGPRLGRVPCARVDHGIERGCWRYQHSYDPYCRQTVIAPWRPATRPARPAGAGCCATPSCLGPYVPTGISCSLLSTRSRSWARRQPPSSVQAHRSGPGVGDHHSARVRSLGCLGGANRRRVLPAYARLRQTPPRADTHKARRSGDDRALGPCLHPPICQRLRTQRYFFHRRQRSVIVDLCCMTVSFHDRNLPDARFGGRGQRRQDVAHDDGRSRGHRTSRPAQSRARPEQWLCWEAI